MLNRNTILQLITLCLVLPTIVFAQEQNNNSKVDHSLLPEINPQDIEIKGQYTARFPGITRQPILGFNPRPRVYQVDPNRLPFMETARNAIAQLPLLHLQSEKIIKTQPTLSPKPHVAWAKLGYGSYNSPQAALSGSSAFSEQFALGAYGSFFKTDGQLDNNAAEYRKADAGLFAIIRPQDRLQIQLGFDMLDQYMYMFPLGTNNLGAKKTLTDYAFLAKVDKQKSAIDQFHTDVHLGRFQMNLGDANQGGKSIENLVRVRLENQWAAKKPQHIWNAGLEYNSVSYDDVAYFEENPQDPAKWDNVGAFGSYTQRIGYANRLRTGLMVKYYNDYKSDGNVAILPNVAYIFEPNDRFSTELGLSSSLEAYSLRELQYQNPFIKSNPDNPHQTDVNVYAKMNYTFNFGTTLGFDFAYHKMNSVGYFIRETIGGQSRYFERELAEDATKAELNGFVLHQFYMDRLWTKLNFTYRQAEINRSSGDAYLPYTPETEVEIRAGGQIIDNLQLIVSAIYIGKRYTTDAPKDSDANFLDAFTLINLEGRYKFLGPWSAYLNVHNIFGTEYEYWEGYTERQFELSGGVRYDF